jgi:hypothetical protein
LFSSNNRGVSTGSSKIAGRITGTITLTQPFAHFVISQPGPYYPDYPHTLGTVQIAESPQFQVRNYGSANKRYNMYKRPTEWKVNPHSGLDPVPLSEQVSISFTLVAGVYLSYPFSYPISHYIPGDLLPYIINYETYSGEYARYNCYTPFIDYDLAQNIVIKTQNNAYISEITAKIKAEFRYNTPGKPNYEFVGNYFAGTPTLTNVQYDIVPAQKKIELYSDQALPNAAIPLSQLSP